MKLNEIFNSDNKALNKFQKKLQQETQVKKITETKFSIQFPMYRIDGELYEIFLIKEDEQFYLSDEGFTYNELDRIFELSEPDVIKNLVAILKRYDCKKKEKCFIIECSSEDAIIKASHLIQAMSFMLNMMIFYV